MKGLLILLLAVNAFAFQTELTSFMRGFQNGLKKAEACKSDPAACGLHVGSIVSYVSKEPLALQTRRILGATIDKQWVQNFLNGLVTGLRQTNATTSQCVSDFQQANNGLAILLSYIMSFDPNTLDFKTIINFACSGTDFLSLDFYNDCNIPLLWQKLSDMNFGDLINNYIGNMCDLNSWFGYIGNCVNVPSQCGFGIGYSIRVLIGWFI